MSDLTFSPEFENQIRAAMAVPDPDPDFLSGLRQQLINQSEEHQTRSKGFFLQPILRWGLAVLAVVLIIVLAIGPQRVASAFQRMLGYIPGIGFVDRNVPIRVLDEPVTQTRAGVTVIVDEAFLDATRTVLVFKYDGIPIPSITEAETDDPTYCTEHSVLRLPDGTELTAGIGWGTGWGSGYEHHFEFPPIPAKVDNAVFYIPCLMGTTLGSAPENWEIPLHFVSKPPEMTVYPVIDLPTPTISPLPSITPVVLVPTDTSQPSQDAIPLEQDESIHLTLDKAVQLEDSYLLYATFYWEDDLYSFISPGMAQLLDADGSNIPIEYADPDFSGVADTQHTPMAVKALGNFPPGPITLMIEDAHAELPVNASFSFDVGSDPQSGDVWELNHEIEISGYTITILSVRAIDTHDHLGFEFSVNTGPDIENVRLVDLEHPPMGGGGGGGGSSQKSVRKIQLLYDNELPTGMLSIAVRAVGLRLKGPWKATWTPSGDFHTETVKQEQASCLTSETWKQAKQQNQALPEIWTGKLAHYGPISEGEDWQISILDLSTSQEQQIGPGTWPSLSPDGRYLTYSGTDGIYVVNLVTGEENLLPGTNQNDYNPLWSPDGTQIAFVRGAGAFELYLIAMDGTGLERLTDGPAYERLGGWLPDGQHILYGEPDSEGILLRLLDIQNGTIEDLFTINNNKDLTVSISPDGTRLAYLERIFGYKNGLIISNLDGSNRQFLGDTNTEVFSDPLWSPDGEWLLLSIWDQQVNNVLPFLALIQVDRCQIIPIPDLTGQFSSWVP